LKIFLIIFDTLRKDHTGKTYGNEWINTANFDTFAKDSLVFDKAYPESLPTIPVRRAIHTGIRTFPFNHKKPQLRSDDVVDIPGWCPIPPDQTHLVEHLKKNGYVASFIASTYHYFKPNMNFHLGYDQWNWIRGHEDDNFRARLRGKKSDIRRKIKEITVQAANDPAVRFIQKHLAQAYLRNIQDRETENDYHPPQVFKKAIEFVHDTKAISNTFCLIDEFDPHEPWDPPKEYLDLYVDKEYTGRKAIFPTYSDNIEYLTEGELKFMRASYAGEVTMCDHWFGEFIRELKNQEIYNDSLIILTSDHGHSIGEHNATGKLPTCLYPELIDIPFMIKPPGNISGPKRIKKTYIYSLDIMATILSIVRKEHSDIFDSKDLSIFIEGEDQLLDNRNYITCGMGLCSLYKDDHHALITSNDRKYQRLFDLTKDPEWNNNIAPSNPDIAIELFNKIEADAKGDLLLDFKSKLDDLKDWYIQSSEKKE